MRTITKEYMDKLRKTPGPIATILSTPKPDHRELNRICAEFEKEMVVEQQKDREIIRKALRAAK